MLYTDPDGKNTITGSQAATMQFTITKPLPGDEHITTAAGIKAKIAELHKQLDLLEVSAIITITRDT